MPFLPMYAARNSNDLIFSKFLGNINLWGTIITLMYWLLSVGVKHSRTQYTKRLFLHLIPLPTSPVPPLAALTMR